MLFASIFFDIAAVVLLILGFVFEDRLARAERRLFRRIRRACSVGGRRAKGSSARRLAALPPRRVVAKEGEFRQVAGKRA